MSSQEIARRLVVLSREQKWESAQKELYAADAVSIEPYDSPDFPKETRGLSAIHEKIRKWAGMVEAMHSVSVSEPIVGGTAFACAMKLDLTMRGQPRMILDELCVYHVKSGKIISEQFYY